MYACTSICGSVSGCVQRTHLTDHNDLKLDKTVVLDTMLQPTDLGFKMARVSVRV